MVQHRAVDSQQITATALEHRRHCIDHRGGRIVGDEILGKLERDMAGSLRMIRDVINRRQNIGQAVDPIIGHAQHRFRTGFGHAFVEKEPCLVV